MAVSLVQQGWHKGMFVVLKKELERKFNPLQLSYLGKANAT